MDFLFVSFEQKCSKAGSVPIPSMSSAVPAKPHLGNQTSEDRYAALAELDNKMSTAVSTGSSVQGLVSHTHTHAHTHIQTLLESDCLFSKKYVAN